MLPAFRKMKEFPRLGLRHQGRIDTGIRTGDKQGAGFLFLREADKEVFLPSEDLAVEFQKAFNEFFHRLSAPLSHHRTLKHAAVNVRRSVAPGPS